MSLKKTSLMYSSSETGLPCFAIQWDTEKLAAVKLIFGLNAALKLFD